jgi:hypothetical protein
MVINHVKFKEKNTMTEIIFQAGKRNAKFNLLSNLFIFSDKIDLSGHFIALRFV